MPVSGKKFGMIVVAWIMLSRITFPGGIPDMPDSLRRRYAIAPDSEKVFLLSSLSHQAIFSSFTRSLEYANAARDIADSLGIPTLQAEAYNRLGTVYYSFNHYQNALEYYSKALTIRLHANDSVGLSQSYVNLGALYQALGNIAKAIEYTQRSLEIREKLNIINNRGVILNNMMVFYTQKEEYQKALDYGKKTLEFYTGLNDGEGIADAYVNLGELYYAQHDLKKAIDFYNKAKQHAVNIHDVSRIIYINNDMITTLLDEKEYEKSLPLIHESLPLAQKYGALDGLTLLYEQVTRYYELEKEFVKASYYQEKYETTKDSLQVSQQKEEIIQQQAKFDAEITDQQLRMIKQRNELEKLKEEKDKHFVFRFIVLIFFMVILCIVLYAFLRSIKTNIKGLKQQNLKLEETNHQLRISENNLQQIIHSKDKFFSIIAHDIINPFQPLLGLSELLVTDIDRLKENEIRKYSGLIHQSANRIFNLLDNLLQWTKSQTDKLSYRPVTLSLKDIIEEELNNFRELAQQKKIVIVIDINDQLKGYGDLELFKGVIRNLVGNAIKFNPVKGTIHISGREVEGKVQISIRDTGIGISKERINKLFLLETITSTKGTQNEDGTGLGLLLCKEFVEKNKGEISVESTPGAGTTFIFTMPVHPTE